MNRVKQIERFLTEYKTLNPYLQSICKDTYDHYTKELGREYERINQHPFPEEYYGIENLNTMNRQDIRTIQTL